MSLVEDIIKIFIHDIEEHDDIVSIILIGSCSRNEETYKQLDKDLVLVSDVEFIVVGNKISEISKKKLQINRNIINKRFSVNVDYSIYDKRKISRIDKRFIIFEAKETGKIVYGEPKILNCFPKISYRNLNKSELNNFIVHRLVKVIKGVTLSDYNERNYVIARNALDFMTVFLAYNKVLISGYKNRFDYILQHYLELDIDVKYLSFLKQCIDIKFNYHEASKVENNDDFLNNIIGLYRYLVKKIGRKRISVVDSREIMRNLIRLNLKKMIFAFRFDIYKYQFIIRLIKALDNSTDNKNILMLEYTRMFPYM